MGAPAVFYNGTIKKIPAMRSLYLLVDGATILVPILFSFHKKIRFDRTFPAFFRSVTIVAAIFVAWDIAFTRAGVWTFNPKYIMGIYIANLPLEEVLFFISIPYSCVFTYYSLNKFYDLTWDPRIANIVSITLSMGLGTIAFVYSHRLYTTVTLTATAVVILLLQFAGRPGSFGRLVTVYLVLLIPFFIVNGILTGTGPAEPVVLYNNGENLHIRLLTIPVEDLFYGFTLVGLNVFCYERLR